MHAQVILHGTTLYFYKKHWLLYTTNYLEKKLLVDRTIMDWS